MSDNGEKLIAGMTRAELDALIAKSKAKEAEKVAAMSPEERAAYDEKNRKWREYQAHLAEKVTLTRGEILEQETLTDQAHKETLAEIERATFGDTLKRTTKALQPHIKNARSNQRGAEKRIEAPEAEVARLTKERDAARLAYVELLGNVKHGAK